MIWRTVTTLRKTRDRGGFPAKRISTQLIHYAGGKHTLAGPRGAIILGDIAERWNAAGVDSPDPSPRCAADYSTDTARRKFHLKLSQ